MGEEGSREAGMSRLNIFWDICIRKEKEFTKNETESLNWYNRAATANKPNSLSAFRLANHLIKNGINQITDRENIVEAYYWILIAINNAYHRDVSKTDLEEMHKLRGELYAAMQGDELIKSLKQYSVIEKLRISNSKKRYRNSED